MEKAIKERVEKWKKENAHDGKEVTNENAYENLTELILDGKKFSSIKNEDIELLKKFKNLERLCLNQTGIQSLEDLPSIETLNVLELTDNHLSTIDILKYIVESFPNIKTLEIGGNHFKNIKDFEVLKDLKNLVRLGVQFNPFTDDPNYRKELFEFLPDVKIIDCFNKEGVEVLSSDEEEDEEYEEDNTLKNFYEADFKDDDEEEDEEFVPNDNEEEDDDELDDDLEEEELDDLDKDYVDVETKESEGGQKEEKSNKRKQDAFDSTNDTDSKKTKVE
ncbi:leucine-rich repeat protein [Plasmodium brasilianum]|uniref:Leucine-rich repeat protein n=1 Tax=Plasmodium brasilianum TaxID=5824 RepID=A0ACB9Y5I6_PLABR|nr:leucine-rich repeat protein [Plasmodium brasilianum]